MPTTYSVCLHPVCATEPVRTVKKFSFLDWSKNRNCASINAPLRVLLLGCGMMVESTINKGKKIKKNLLLYIQLPTKTRTPAPPHPTTIHSGGFVLITPGGFEGFAGFGLVLWIRCDVNEKIANP